ncbi:hypothetical protein J3F84DRAFT_239399 [Trichoderma pleuroticola]
MMVVAGRGRYRMLKQGFKSVTVHRLPDLLASRISAPAWPSFLCIGCRTAAGDDVFSYSQSVQDRGVERRVVAFNVSRRVEKPTDCRIYAHLVSYTCCRALYEAEDRRFGANDGDVERVRGPLAGRYSKRRGWAKIRVTKKKTSRFPLLRQVLHPVPIPQCQSALQIAVQLRLGSEVPFFTCSIISNRPRKQTAGIDLSSPGQAAETLPALSSYY